MANSINVESLSKSYQIGQLHDRTLLQETLLSWIRHPLRKLRKETQSIWALRDVSFQVEEGEVVGIIGRNGAGKSTLLKMLSKISHPTSGRISVHGRVAALLEVGTGFHGDLTGRENIFLNGSILGMTKKEVAAKLDSIVSFAGVEKFLETPVKHYSTGMFLRLGFAVAAHLEPAVLLVDEVLAVGDAGFQKKCLNAMDDLRKGGRTVLFVSHNMAAVENLCSRAIWIDNGQVRQDGKATEVIEAYLATFAVASQLASDLTDMNRRGNGNIQFTRIEFIGADGQSLRFIRSGDPLTIRLHYSAKTRITNLNFEVGVYTDLGTMVTKFSTWIDYEIPRLSPGSGYIDLEIHSFNFQPGRYFLSLWLKSPGPTFYDVLEHCAQFEIEPSDFYGTGKGISPYFGIVFLPCKWKLHRLLDENDSIGCQAGSATAC